MTKLPDPGFYILKDDVKNPNSDRRNKHDLWSRVKVSSGLVFEVEHTKSGVKTGGVDVVMVSLRHAAHPTQLLLGWIVSGKRHDLSDIDKKDLIPLLLDALAPFTPKNFDQLWNTISITQREEAGRTSLKYLMQQGNPTLKELGSIIEKFKDYSLYDDIGEMNSDD